MEEESLLKKQIASTRNMLFIVAAVTVIAGILLVPQVGAFGDITDLVVTFSIAVVYLVLAFWTKTRPFTAFRVGLGLTLALIVAGLITNSPGLAGHWPSRVISIGLFFLGLADSKDAERKIKAR
jgi:hypothetical protein